MKKSKLIFAILITTICVIRSNSQEYDTLTGQLSFNCKVDSSVYQPPGDSPLINGLSFDKYLTGEQNTGITPEESIYLPNENKLIVYGPHNIAIFDGNTSDFETVYNSISFLNTNYRKLLYIYDQAYSVHKAILYPWTNDPNVAYYFNGENDNNGSYSLDQDHRKITSVYYDDSHTPPRIHYGYNEVTKGLAVCSYGHVLLDDIAFNPTDIRYIYKSIKGDDKIFLAEEEYFRMIDINSNPPYQWSIEEEYPGDYLIDIEYNQANHKGYYIHYLNCDLTTFDQQGSTVDEMKVGGATFTGCYDEVHNKSYLYDYLSDNKQSITINNFQTEDTDIVTFTDVGEGNITGAVFDELRNKVYVSFFADDYNTIRVIDGNTNEISTEFFDLTSNSVCKGLFLANDKLYCVTRTNDKPGLEIFNLETSQHHVQLLDNNQLYGYLFPKLSKNKDGDVIIGYRDLYSGRIIVVDGIENSIIYSQSTNRPTGITCNSFNNNIYFSAIGPYYNQNVLGIIDGNLSSGPNYINIEHSGNYEESIAQIEFSPLGNQLYVLYTYQKDYKTHSAMKILNGESNQITQTVDLGRLAFSAKYCPRNGKLYVFCPVDSQWYAGMLLMEFDPGTDELERHNMDCYQMSYEVNVVTQNKLFYDHDDNTLIIPGGYHSAVFTTELPDDRLNLREGWTWLSYPRLNSNPEDAISVLTGNIEPENFADGTMINLPPQEPYEVNIDYYNGIWNPLTLQNVYHERGYKIFLDNPMEEREMILNGEIADPYSEINIYAGYDNWVGYYLPQTQNIFDALPQDVIDDYISIKHQDWMVYRKDIPDPPPPDGACREGWVCPDGVYTQIKYGDMVVIRTLEGNTFQWLTPGSSQALASIVEPESFEYEEQADYTPIFVELDTTANPLEIGAFVNDTCVGAVVVNESDSLTQIRAYTDSTNTGDITFQEYYGTKSTNGIHKEYLVQESASGKYVKRTIHTSESKPFYHVSFRNRKSLEIIESAEEVRLHLIPNPCSDCSIEYYVPGPGKVNIETYNTQGKKMSTFEQHISDKGTYRYSVNKIKMGLNEASKGVYIVKLLFKDRVLTKKLIIN